MEDTDTSHKILIDINDTSYSQVKEKLEKQASKWGQSDNIPWMFGYAVSHIAHLNRRLQDKENIILSMDKHWSEKNS